MFRMEGEFKAEDGYHVLEIHDKDEIFHQAVIEAMKVKGYDVYGMSDLGTSIQYNFVTAEFAEVLKERHIHSCRNSLAGAFTLPTVPAEVDPQCIGRAFRAGASKAEVIFVDLDPGNVREKHTHADSEFFPNDLSPGLGSQIMGSGRLDD